MHALPGTEPDQVGLELSHHGQDDEQQPADRVGGVVDRPAQAEADLTGREFVGDSPGVGQGPGETVEFGHHQGVAGPAGSKRLAEPGSLTVGAGEAVVDVDPFGLDTQAKQSVALTSQVLLIARAAGVPDKQRAHGAPPEDGPVVPHNAADPSIGQRPTITTDAPHSRLQGQQPKPHRDPAARRRKPSLVAPNGLDHDSSSGGSTGLLS